MIKFHPTDDMLQAFAAGNLPTSMAIAISAHVELCDKCAEHVDRINQQLADDAFSKDVPDSVDMDDILESIMSEDPPSSESLAEEAYVSRRISVDGKQYTLPRALRRYTESKWSSFGKIQRARLPLEEGETRASLLHISVNGTVPSHTHRGYELTLLLEGTFEDENDKYVPGDFILLDSRHHHTPYTKEGCLCYTIADAPLHFTKGVSKLLNSVGHAIY